MGKFLLAVLAAVCLAAGLRAAAVTGAVRPAGQVDWKASGSLPPGAEYHLIHEDPATKGVQALVRFASGYVLPEHSHSYDETIVVLKGKLAVTRAGETTTLGPGGYAVFPAGEAHALAAKSWGGCDFALTMSGAFDIQGLPPGK